ncbi:MAG: hypothetical protein SOU51_06325 [Collinsella sp.]|nr:hypothetical protein [Collinsella sp.]
MGKAAKTAAAIYLLAGTAVAVALSATLFDPLKGRFEVLLANRIFRIALIVCLAICVLQMLYVLARIILDRPEPECVRPAGSDGVEVTVAALESVARSAARDRDALIEDVRCRVMGRDASALKVDIEAIALTDAGLDTLAARIRDRVDASLATLLGSVESTVRVRFLPSKTTTTTREVSGER